MDLIAKSRHWLAQEVFPLWTKQGIDPRSGSFMECLTRDGQPMAAPRRAMVQARQIYAFAEAARMELIPLEDCKRILVKAVDYFIAKYSLPNGAFVHSIDLTGSPVGDLADLYTQAFALFGLAEAYRVLGEARLKERAKKLLSYLQKERRLPCGGYSEMMGPKIAYEANPHMHLFEAAIVWMSADQDGEWSRLAAELDQLCRTKFIDPATGALCEHYGPDWTRIGMPDGFAWEPGHHFEWAWLFVQYENAGGAKAGTVPASLYKLAEEKGVNQGAAVDEMWSNGKVKKGSSRFWPQGERVKAAVALGHGDAADQALEQLFSYFSGMKPGLWEDTRSESGDFVKGETVKASSLYHIINAMSEYARLRPSLGAR